MQRGAAGAFRATARGLDDHGPVLGPRHGGEAAGGRHVEEAAAVEPFLGPVEDCLDAPSRAGSAGPHLPLPAVERALLGGGSHPGADRCARIVGPESPGARLVGVPHGGGQLGAALGVLGEPGEYGHGERAEPGVVVTQRQLVQGPGPVGTGRGVAPQQGQGVVAAVRGQVSEDRQGQAGP